MIRFALLLLLGLAGPAAAGGPAATIAAAEARLARAGAALAAARAAPDRVSPLGVAVADYDAALRALRSALSGAAAHERDLALELADRREEITRLLAALQAVGRDAPERGLHPKGPLAAARASAMLDALAPELRARADALAADLEALAAARALRVDGGRALARALAALNAGRADLRTAIAASPAAELDPELVALARESESLTALAAALAGGGEAAAPPRSQSLLWPVTGAVLRGFQAPDAAGVRRPGLVVEASPGSLVRAPEDATVRYAGPFLDYGYVAVLEPDPATMVVLAGLAHVRVAAGATVKRGELLGLLGGGALDAEEHVMLPGPAAGAGAAETLYIEIRHGAGPVDPEPWFAGGNG